MANPFRESQRRHRELTAAYERAELDADQFATELSRLAFEDDQQFWWQIQGDGSWLRFDGESWAPASPPRLPPPPPPASALIPPPRAPKSRQSPARRGPELDSTAPSPSQPERASQRKSRSKLAPASQPEPPSPVGAPDQLAPVSQLELPLPLSPGSPPAANPESSGQPAPDLLPEGEPDDSVWLHSGVPAELLGNAPVAGEFLLHNNFTDQSARRG